MVMKIGVECEQSLIITLTFDDESTKTQVLSKGDYVSVCYNFNGTRRLINGTVKQVYANPYNGKSSRHDWYIIVQNDNPESVHNHRNEKIAVLNILDLEVITSSRYDTKVTTPNNATRITTIRLYKQVLQISPDNGRTWFNVGGPVNTDYIADDIDVAEEIHKMIGSDQYADSDEFIKGIIELVNKLVNRERSKVDKAIRESWPYPPVDPNKPFLSDHTPPGPRPPHPGPCPPPPFPPVTPIDDDDITG